VPDCTPLYGKVSISEQGANGWASRAPFSAISGFVVSMRRTLLRCQSAGLWCKANPAGPLDSSGASSTRGCVGAACPSRLQGHDSVAHSLVERPALVKTQMFPELW
jgi:hypothetical protein